MGVAGITFALAWAVGMTAGVLSVAQWIAILLFRPWAFRFGLGVVSEQRTIPQPDKPFRAGDVLETANGKFRFLSPEECLFRGKMRWYYNKPLPLPGIIRWSGDQAQIRCRLPVPVAILAAAVLVGWTSALAPIVLESERRGVIGLAVAAVLFVVLGAFAGGAGLARDRSRDLVRELEAVLAGAVEPAAVDASTSTSASE